MDLKQKHTLAMYLRDVKHAKSILNGGTVDKVLDSFGDNPPAELVRLASTASQALSALVAYLESPGNQP